MSFVTRKLLGLSMMVTFAGAAACGSDSPTGGNPPITPGAATLRGNITANRTLYAETTYVLSGFVNVQNGATLTIRPGTKIVGDTTVVGSALFIHRGAKIDAQGTATNPIVFTSQRPAGSRKPGDWGGVIIVGNARINRAGTIVLEGSNASVPGADPAGVNYGNGPTPNDADNSGTLRYVRVEFAGYAVLQDAELNSFTLASVGSGTTLEYLQSMSALDDAFEWFGGAVDGRYLVSYESGDDHFDASEGYRGRNQFLIAMQSTQITPRPGTGTLSADPQGFEVDGCSGAGCTAPAGGSVQSSTPYTMPVFANFTVIGTGSTTTSGSSGGVGMVLRRGTGGTYLNGLVARWPRQGLSVRDSTTNNRMSVDSLIVRNILFAENAANYDAAGSNYGQSSRFTSASHTESAATASSLLAGLPAAGAVPTLAALDFTPTGAATSGGLTTFSGVVAARAGTFVTGTAYVGAAAPGGPKWWQGWTNYARD